MLQMTIHRINCWEVLSLTALPLDLNKGVRYSRCKPYPTLNQITRFQAQWVKLPGFHYMQVATKANERTKLERLCRYITRPAVSTKRLSLTRNGQVRYELKTPWRNGTTHVIFEPLDFMYRMYGMPWAQGCAGTAKIRRV